VQNAIRGYVTADYVLAELKKHTTLLKEMKKVDESESKQIKTASFKKRAGHVTGLNYRHAGRVIADWVAAGCSIYVAMLAADFYSKNAAAGADYVPFKPSEELVTRASQWVNIIGYAYWNTPVFSAVMQFLCDMATSPKKTCQRISPASCKKTALLLLKYAFVGGFTFFATKTAADHYKAEPFKVVMFWLAEGALQLIGSLILTGKAPQLAKVGWENFCSYFYPKDSIKLKKYYYNKLIRHARDYVHQGVLDRSKEKFKQQLQQMLNSPDEKIDAPLLTNICELMMADFSGMRPNAQRYHALRILQSIWRMGAGAMQHRGLSSRKRISTKDKVVYNVAVMTTAALAYASWYFDPTKSNLEKFKQLAINTPFVALCLDVAVDKMEGVVDAMAEAPRQLLESLQQSNNLCEWLCNGGANLASALARGGVNAAKFIFSPRGIYKIATRGTCAVASVLSTATTRGFEAATFAASYVKSWFVAVNTIGNLTLFNLKSMLDMLRAGESVVAVLAGGRMEAFISAYNALVEAHREALPEGIAFLLSLENLTEEQLKDFFGGMELPEVFDANIQWQNNPYKNFVHFMIQQGRALGFIPKQEKQSSPGSAGSAMFSATTSGHGAASEAEASSSAANVSSQKDETESSEQPQVRSDIGEVFESFTL
jgi:hypothetical protein